MTSRPSFGLSNWASSSDDDAWAAWQVRVDAGRIGDGGDGLGGARAANAMADEMERIVLGRPVRAFRSSVASGSSTSKGSSTSSGPSTSGGARGGAGAVFHLDVASGSSTSGAVKGG